MDHHVQGAITRGLRARGIDVLTAEEDGTKRWPDDRLLDELAAAAKQRPKTQRPSGCHPNGLKRLKR